MQAELIYYHAKKTGAPHPTRIVPESYLELRVSATHDGGTYELRDRLKAHLGRVCAALLGYTLWICKRVEPEALQNYRLDVESIKVSYLGGQRYCASGILLVQMKPEQVRYFSTELTNFSELIFFTPIDFSWVGSAEAA